MDYFKRRLSIFILLISLWSCREITCIEYVKLVKNDEFNIVLQETGRARLHLKGINPETGHYESFKSQNYLWLGACKNTMQLNDTIVKKSGLMSVKVFKSDTVIVYAYKCDGRVYE
jgi:hypothetical protein